MFSAIATVWELGNLNMVFLIEMGFLLPLIVVDLGHGVD